MCSSHTSRALMIALAAVLVLTAVKISPLKAVFQHASAQAADEVVLDQTFPVRAGERLNIEVSHSDVIVEQATGSEARVRITLEGRDMDEAREFYERLNFEVEHEDGTLAIRNNPQLRWNGSNGGADVQVYIEVPEVFDADIDVAHGDVRIAGMKGELAFRIAHADLDLGTAGGSAFTLDMAHGDIRADALMNEKIRVDIQHGDVDVRTVSGAEIEIAAAHGDIDIEELDGFSRVAAQHGDISVAFARLRGGEFQAQHGEVDLSMAPDTRADVDIEASEVDLDSAFGFEGTQREGSFQGRINGGGEKLTIRTSHGDVSLRAR